MNQESDDGIVRAIQTQYARFLREKWKK